MKTENLDFDGLAGDGVNRSGNKWSGNQHGGKAGGNYGMGPRVGNRSPEAGGKDNKVIATAAQGGKINGGAQAKCPSNPDKINVGTPKRKGNE